MPQDRGSLTKIPDSLTYYQHQLEGIRTLASRRNWLLADDMGLGKSVQALTVAAIDWDRGMAKRMLIVCPASLKGNWGAEIDKLTHFTYMILDGTPTQRIAQIRDYEDSGCDVLICNYEQVRTHLEDLNFTAFDIVIYDEAHYLKNHASKRTKACLKLEANRHFLLTGTPMLNNVTELWPLLHRITPTRFPNFWPFKQKYALMGGFKAKQIVGIKNEDELRDHLHALMLRRTKTEVLDLPEKQHIQLWVDLHKRQRELYDEAIKELTLTIDGETEDLENPLTRYLRLKQICGTTATVEEGTDVSAKLDLLVDRVEQVTSDGSPTVVFTQFRGTLAAAEARLKDAGHPVFVLHGDVPAVERQGVVAEWARTPGAVMVGMLQVMGVGLTMTEADTCFFLDKLYVPGLNAQAEDRLHRIGQTSTVQIFQILANDTIESRIEQILTEKAELFEGIVDASEYRRVLLAELREALNPQQQQPQAIGAGT